MAAYAALVSLTNTIDYVRNHPRLSIFLDRNQTESLHEKVAFLLDFIETSHSHGSSKEAEELESQIASAAHAAEDVIESHLVDQILAGSNEGHDQREQSVPLIDIQGETEETKNYIKGKAVKSMYSIGLLCDLKKVTKKMDSIKKKEVKVEEENLVEQIHSGSISSLDLQTVIQDMDAVKDKVVTVKEERRMFKDKQPTYAMPPATSSTPPTNTMMGFDGELTRLMDALLGHNPSLQIIPIVGMGGSGKTTLAKHVYERFRTLLHFEVCAWSTISQKFSVGEISSKLLFRQNTSPSDTGRETEQQLAQELYQSLISKKYLVILDDMWSIEAWEQIQFFFPDNSNGSRIIITTRLLDLASHFGPSFLKMSCLDADRSWKLFCQNAFGQEEGCPRELERIGKKIVEKCKGLPLSIVVIGGLLGKSLKTQEYWEYFAIIIGNSILNLEDDPQSLDILSLSYSHLPAHLKPCFLYMGIFPEDHNIHVSRLIKLWVAEGFIKPNKTQSLEEVAEGYLKDLVDRNLIAVGRLGWNGKIKTCNIHDLLRDLCLMAAQKERFLYVMDLFDIPGGIDNERRIVFDDLSPQNRYGPLDFHGLKPSASVARSFVSNRRLPWLKFRLLRVFDVEGNDSPLDDVLDKQVNMRYFRKPYVWGYERFFHVVPSSIYLLWNLQTLIIRHGESVVAPLEIWKMPQLRHVDCVNMYLPEPLLSDHQQDESVLMNLQTLQTTMNLTLSEEVCKRIINVKKLKITYDRFAAMPYRCCLYNLCLLGKLESLSCSFESMPIFGGWLHYWSLKFPSSLKKLSLKGCYLHCQDLMIIGCWLPNLEVLNLKERSIFGPVWNLLQEGGFLRLKSLKISRNYLLHWNADSSHFPALEKLVLEDLVLLHEIPLSFGEMQTLRSIDLHRCSDSAAFSAMKILEEQKSLGNDDLRVRVVTVDDEMRLFEENLRRRFGNYTD
ncbi:hypothetical protein ABFX02_04G168100 [Erythranthe guttata]